jgi:hypothetical protein
MLLMSLSTAWISDMAKPFQRLHVCRFRFLLFAFRAIDRLCRCSITCILHSADIEKIPSSLQSRSLPCILRYLRSTACRYAGNFICSFLIRSSLCRNSARISHAHSSSGHHCERCFAFRSDPKMDPFEISKFPRGASPSASVLFLSA